MRELRETHGASVIPKGCYCYSHLRFADNTTDGIPRMESDTCPYWDIDEEKPPQMNGYCWFMEKGDWDDGGGGLLWDQCKEYGVDAEDELDR